MAEKTDESPASEEGGKKKSGKKKLIIVLVLLLLLGGGGAGAFLVLGKKEDPKENKEEHLEEEHPQLVFAPLDPPFIVNLADSGSYLKATIYLEFDIEKAKKMELDLAAAAGHGSGGSGGGEKGPPKLEGILKVKEPLVRDVVIRVLSSKTVDEARSTSQRDALKGELVEAINDVVGEGDGPVTNVIFTEYIVQ
jgi:flagellar FliL protein